MSNQNDAPVRGPYKLTDDDQMLIKRIIGFVRMFIAKLQSVGKWADDFYRSQSIQEREAMNNKMIGLPVEPQTVLPLRKRFDWWLLDMANDDTGLNVLPPEKCVELATQRVLLVWLLLDPGRGIVAQITAFQRLRNEPTFNGLMSLWPPDNVQEDLENQEFTDATEDAKKSLEGDVSIYDESLFVRSDGLWRYDKHVPTLLKMACEAMKVLVAEWGSDPPDGDACGAEGAAGGGKPKAKTTTKKTVKAKGGRPKVSTDEAGRRWEFKAEVKRRKQENGTTMAQVAGEWGLSEEDGRAYLQWCRDKTRKKT